MNSRDASTPPSDETQLEQTLRDKGLNAPRVTPQQIDEIIEREFYFTAADGVCAYHPATEVLIRSATPEGLKEWDAARASFDSRIPQPLRLLTFCVLVLRNGFTVTGESACASPANFDEQVGRDIAKRNARDKIWALEGYLLRETLHRTGR